MLTFDTPEPITADLDVEAGHIRIIAGKRATTVVDVRPMSEARKADLEAAERTRVDLVGGVLEVRSSRPRYLGLLWRPGSIDVVVQLPLGSRLRGQLSYGNVSVEGPVGDCAVKTSYGDLRVDDAASADLHTSSGSITVGRVSGAIEASASWGSIRIGEAGSATNVKTAGGDILVQKSAAAVQARTSYGEVRVVEASRGSLTLATSYGNVVVGVRDGTAAFLDATSQRGRVVNDLEPSADPSVEPKDTLTVRARTSFGDITISRA